MTWTSKGRAVTAEWRGGRRRPWITRSSDRDAALREREAVEAEGQQPGPPEEVASPKLKLRCIK